MTIYNAYIFDKFGKCLLYFEWNYKNIKSLNQEQVKC